MTNEIVTLTPAIWWPKRSLYSHANNTNCVCVYTNISSTDRERRQTYEICDKPLVKTSVTLADIGLDIDRQTRTNTVDITSHLKYSRIAAKMIGFRLKNIYPVYIIWLSLSTRLLRLDFGNFSRVQANVREIMPPQSMVTILSRPCPFIWKLIHLDLLLVWGLTRPSERRGRGFGVVGKESSEEASSLNVSSWSGTWLTGVSIETPAPGAISLSCVCPVVSAPVLLKGLAVMRLRVNSSFRGRGWSVSWFVFCNGVFKKPPVHWHCLNRTFPSSFSDNGMIRRALPVIWAMSHFDDFFDISPGSDRWWLKMNPTTEALRLTQVSVSHRGCTHSFSQRPHSFSGSQVGSVSIAQVMVVNSQMLVW